MSTAIFMADCLCLGTAIFIHTYAREHGIDKLLFLSRDGDILRQAYAVLFPEEKTEYVYWSRAAATKLMARYNRYDFSDGICIIKRMELIP